MIFYNEYPRKFLRADYEPSSFIHHKDKTPVESRKLDFPGKLMFYSTQLKISWAFHFRQLAGHSCKENIN